MWEDRRYRALVTVCRERVFLVERAAQRAPTPPRRRRAAGAREAVVAVAEVQEAHLAARFTMREYF